MSVQKRTKLPNCKYLKYLLSFIKFIYFSIWFDALYDPRHVVHSSHQFFGEVTNQNTNFKSSVFLFQVTKMCYIIQLQLQVWNVYCNWIIQQNFVTWNKKFGDLVEDFTKKNWWLEWTAHRRCHGCAQEKWNICQIFRIGESKPTISRTKV